MSKLIEEQYHQYLSLKVLSALGNKPVQKLPTQRSCVIPSFSQPLKKSYLHGGTSQFRNCQPKDESCVSPSFSQHCKACTLSADSIICNTNSYNSLQPNGLSCRGRPVTLFPGRPQCWLLPHDWAP